MISIEQTKSNFFDREPVIRAMEKATRQALSRGGAIVMREARKSIKDAAIRKRGGPRGAKREITGYRVSQPGKPPFSRTGLLKDFILFSAERTLSGWTAVVGPALINSPTGAPHTLEFGGFVNNKAGYALMKAGRDEKGRFQPDRYVRLPERRVHVAARPYMAPALQRMVDRGRVPDLWKNAVVNGA